MYDNEEISPQERLERAEARVRRLQSSKPTQWDDSDHRIKWNREYEKARNIIRESQGVPTKDITGLLTSEEITNYIEYDLIDEVIENITDIPQKEKIKQRTKEIRVMNQLYENQRTERNKFFRDMMEEINHLAETEPKQTIPEDGGKVRLNKAYNSWIDSVIDVQRRLDRKVKGIEASGKSIPDDRPDIQKLIDALDKLKQ